MTKKECFLNEVLALTGDAPEKVFTSDALDYWNGLNSTGANEKTKFTKIGSAVLKYMQANKDNYNNIFKSREIGEGLGIASRSVSGSMKKLVTDGYVEKIGSDPVIYSITSLGMETNPDDYLEESKG